MSAYDDANYGSLTMDAVIASGWAERIVIDDTVWAKILEFPYYYVSSDCRVMSFIGSEGVELRQWKNAGRYPAVDLRDLDGNKKHKYVHDLVARYINGGPGLPKHKVVRHLDDDPTNNYPENLEWGTYAENVQDMRDNGHMFLKPVYCFELDMTFPSCAEAADYFGVTRSSVTNCCKGKIHTIGDKYHLCYLDQKEDVKRNRNLTKYGNYKRVRAVNITTGETIIFNSRQEASTTLGIPNSAISNVIAGRIRQTHGWYFDDYEGR